MPLGARGLRLREDLERRLGDAAEAGLVAAALAEGFDAAHGRQQEAGQPGRVVAAGDVARALSGRDASRQQAVELAERLAGASGDLLAVPGARGRGRREQAAPVDLVRDDGVGVAQDVVAEPLVGLAVGALELAARTVNHRGAVVVEDAHEQGVLVAEGAVQAALAEAGRGGDVVDLRARVAGRPEPVPRRAQDRAFVEAPRSGHGARIGILDYFVQNGVRSGRNSQELGRALCGCKARRRWSPAAEPASAWGSRSGSPRKARTSSSPDGSRRASTTRSPRSADRSRRSARTRRSSPTWTRSTGRSPSAAAGWTSWWPTPAAA